MRIGESGIDDLQLGCGAVEFDSVQDPCMERMHDACVAQHKRDRIGRTAGESPGLGVRVVPESLYGILDSLPGSWTDTGVIIQYARYSTDSDSRVSGNIFYGNCACNLRASHGSPVPVATSGAPAMVSIANNSSRDHIVAQPRRNVKHCSGCQEWRAWGSSLRLRWSALPAPSAYCANHRGDENHASNCQSDPVVKMQRPVYADRVCESCSYQGSDDSTQISHLGLLGRICHAHGIPYQ